MFDGGGGALHEVPKASMREIRQTPTAEPRSTLPLGDGGGLPDGPSWPGRSRPLDPGARRTSRIDLSVGRGRGLHDGPSWPDHGHLLDPGPRRTFQTKLCAMGNRLRGDLL